MASTQSSEARELSLIDKVELRIALADDDAKLQSILATYLAPLLLKLASEHVNVRNKIITICQHINTRVQPENIQLPISSLVKQFKDQNASHLVRHFDVVYIQKGFPRLTVAERAKLFPIFTTGISNFSSAPIAQASILFNLFLKSLVEFVFPPKDSSEEMQLRTTLGLSDADAEYLSKWIGKLMLLKLETRTGSSTGLSQEEIAFLTLQGKEGLWNNSILMNVKYKCVKLISSNAFTNSERLTPLLMASGDSNARLSSLAEDTLKLTLPDIDTNDSSIVEMLYSLYMQASGTPSQTFSSSASLRIKILGLLAKTPTSTTFVEKIRIIVTNDLVRNISDEGREALKLRSGIVQLISNVARNAASENLKVISRDLLDGVKHFLDQQHDVRGSADLIDLRCRGFEVIGILIAADIQILLDTELPVQRWLFRNLLEERDKQVVFSIDEALSRTIRPIQLYATSGLLEHVRTWLRDCLSLQEDSHTGNPNSRHALHAILRFANRCLPFSDVFARSINVSILGSTQSNTQEIVEEAQKGLDPYWMSLVQAEKSNVKPPDFQHITDYLLSGRENFTKEPHTTSAAVQFCRRCLFWHCLSGNNTTDFVVDWENRMDSALDQDPETRLQVHHFLENQSETGMWERVITLFESAIKYVNADLPDRKLGAKLITDLVMLSPNGLLQKFAVSFQALIHPLVSNDREMRTLIAQSFGILASHPTISDDKVSRPITTLFEQIEGRASAIGVDSNRVHGAMIGLAHFTSRRVSQGGSGSNGQSDVDRLLAAALEMLDDSSDSNFPDAAYRSLSQLCMMKTVTYQQIDSIIGFSLLIDKVGKASKGGDGSAIMALGHISIILDEEEHGDSIDQIFQQAQDLHTIRQPDTQFSVGETMATLGYAWRSKAMAQYLNMAWRGPPASNRDQELAKIMDKILIENKNTKPAMKKASVIWLLCLLQFCGEERAIQEHLPRFQAAFKRCLSDRDELVQESASRGLGLVYEKGGRELKNSLVRDLIGSFSSDKKDMSGTVTEETELFEPGTLPTGDGSVSTYKDIMSLASEVGDPSLVYRFMSLASNNAIWSNRAAFGRFGLSNVLSDSSVDGYLADNPKVYSALYRYRFDPNSNVRRSMNDIWNALVKDPQATITKYFDLIIKDLLEQMTGREWRTRQASCGATADLLQGRKLDTIQPYLDQTWAKCFKVLDDIKQSVRQAATDLARVLTNILLRNLESSEGKGEIISSLLESVIPFILSTSGLESSAKDVQKLSLHTLLEIIKKGKPQLLRPFIPNLIQELLGLLTSFEPEVVNYVALNASQYNLSQSDIDEARLQSIRMSPIMEAIERGLDMLDQETMARLAPKLQEAMRSAVGEPSKVGSSRVLVSLSTRKNFVFRPFADQFLSSVEKRVSDRNATVSSSYAACMGYIARLASDRQILRTVQFAKQLYFGEADDERPRFVAAEIIQAIAKYATDRFNALASGMVPFVFFGRFDDTAHVREVFKETYNDNVSSSRAASLYLEEIVSLSKEQLGSPKWTFKHAAAKALAEAAEGVGSSVGGMSVQQAATLWEPLRTALSEKSWNGKGRVLEGFVVWVERGSGFWYNREVVIGEIKKIAQREARRRNKEYQVTALACMGKIAAAMREQADMLRDVSEITTAVVADVADPMELDSTGSRGDDGAKDQGSGRGRDDLAITTQLVCAAIEATMGSLRLKEWWASLEPKSKADVSESAGTEDEGMGECGEVQDLCARACIGLDVVQSALTTAPAPHVSSSTSNASSAALFTTTVYASLMRLVQALNSLPTSSTASSSTAAPTPDKARQTTHDAAHAALLIQLAAAARPDNPLPFLDRLLELILSPAGANMQEKPRATRAQAISVLVDVFPFSSPHLAHHKSTLASRLQSLIDHEKALSIKHVLLDAQRRLS